MRANEIVQLAVEHSARVILEDLKNLSTIRQLTDISGLARACLLF
jgi:hypothetical protein